MYSRKDLERFYFQYKTEALPHGESVQSFCLRKKVPYKYLSEMIQGHTKKDSGGEDEWLAYGCGGRFRSRGIIARAGVSR